MAESRTREDGALSPTPCRAHTSARRVGARDGASQRETPPGWASP